MRRARRKYRTYSANNWDYQRLYAEHEGGALVPPRDIIFLGLSFAWIL
jgi:hypothetical protein